MVMISESRWRKIEKALLERPVQLLSEDETAALLNITVRTLQNRVYDGTIPASAYKKSVTGSRFYIKEKLFV